MFKNKLLLIALTMTIGVSIWGMIDTQGLSEFATDNVRITLRSRGWLIMLTVSALLITSLILAFSGYGRIKLGHDNEKPEFSTMSWSTMMFAAGMGVGLLFYGAAEPISHYLFISGQGRQHAQAAHEAKFITIFNWGCMRGPFTALQFWSSPISVFEKMPHR